jgi:hypothetical protein
MTAILDTITAARAARVVFHPTTITELLALRLAHKRPDARAVAHYADVLARFSEPQVLGAFHRATNGQTPEDWGKTFHRELAHVLTKNSFAAGGSPSRVLGLRVERRAIAAAVFYGNGLEYTQVKQLPSNHNKVLGSALAFVAWLLDQFSFDSVAVEPLTLGDSQRSQLSATIKQAVRERLLPVWEVPANELIGAFGEPRPRFRTQLRQLVSGMWPILSDEKRTELICDAVALAAFVQIERRFLR